ncbi:juvenile hormone esterase-like [Trichoplusia ni]|uniref:Juvenile hormone esterase-like n=1 Tax=Trichoplusia ni TaxID=7111 RepID=A0A7E5VDF7_TRINI|nr:juvenile hormone esterase-like [Trichoplusia ni]
MRAVVMDLYPCLLLLCMVTVYVTFAQQPSDEDWLELDTPQGPVRGRRDPETELYVFYNIPYATAPVKENKYKAPLPPPIWKTPLDAIDKHVICPQTTISIAPLPDNLVTQEDCLIANVYVPDTRKKNLTLLVYVHGGAFVMGYGDAAKMTNLLKEKDIILVTFNYRLGIHGFLCLGTEDVPGNAGMKDQVALLRWVRDNIASYGGNPSDVALAGYSAGAAAVDLLMLSKTAEGLFHRVIPESGGNLAAFSIQRDPLDIAKNHAKRLNFTKVDDVYALEYFYKTASWELLTLDSFYDRTDGTFVFSPCLERETREEAFFTESPLSILQKGSYRKIPVLYGFTQMEGLMRVHVHYEDWKHKMNEKFSDFLSADLTFKTGDEKEEVANKIKKFFFGGKQIGDDNILSYIDYFSDTIFAYPMLWAVKLHGEAGNNEVYLYEYSFVNENTPLVPQTNIRGADHCAQSAAIWDGANYAQANEQLVTPEYLSMKKTMRQIWRNFIRTGKPVPEGSSLPAWPAAGVDRAPYMSLGQKVELRHEPLLETRYRFWEDIYQKYYRAPIPPPTPESPRCQDL